MDLPVMPPVKPMLAKPVPAVPEGMLYEPKWDGFRSIIFRDGDEVEIASRNTRPMTRYFPEVVEALLANLPPRCVVDGELVVPVGDRLDFESLQQRIHPAASRIKRLAVELPASFVAFDLLAEGDEALVDLPFAQRRRRLEQALAAAAPPVHVTPATDDVELARRWLEQFEGAGLDGLIAKPMDGGYVPDRRTMLKIKHDRTADCVVAGYRPHKSGADAVGSLLLGLYERDEDEDAGSADSAAAPRLQAVGVCAAFPMAQRRELVEQLAPLVVDMVDHPWTRDQAVAGTRTPWDAGESRWSAGKTLEFVPLRPATVVEVRYDHMEGPRFRHTTQFIRFRPDRDPESCTYAQLYRPVSYDLAQVLGHGG